MNAKSSPSASRAWLALLRPHTLPASISPVAVAIAYALTDGTFRPLQAILALVVAVTAQTVSNVANDWFDYKKGADTDARVGFERGISKGWLSERQVLGALFFFIILLALSGLALCAVSSWWMLGVGIVVAIGALAYSAGPYPLAYHGLGEVAVFVFYGLVPVLFTYYVQAGHFPMELWHLGASMGFAGVNILVVNNYRDYAEDRRSGKRTILVIKGRDLGPRLYLACGLLSIMVLYPFYSAPGFLFLLFYLAFLMTNYRRLSTQDGAALNPLLARTARALFLLAAVTIAMLYLS